MQIINKEKMINFKDIIVTFEMVPINGTDNGTKEILLSRLTIFVFILSVLFILIDLLYLEPEIP